MRDVEAGLEQGLLGSLRAIAQLVPLAAILFVLSPRLAAVAVAVLGAFGWMLGRARAGTQRAVSREALEREQLLAAADESVRHAELWVSYGAEARARSRVKALGDALARGTARWKARAAAVSGANEVLGAAALLVALVAARAGWIGDASSGPRMLGFAVAFFLAYRPLRELADARLVLHRADAAFEALRAFSARARDANPAFLDRSLDPSLDAAPRAPEWAPGPLELRGLALARGGSGPLDLKVEAGSCVAIAGPTGAGKTTLLRTLLGLEAPAAGDLLYGGRSIADAPAGPAARPFAWVPQDAPLLADTLADNVALGVEGGAGDIDPRDLLSRIGGAGAGHLADALQGVRLGAGGRPVSGGERQWIALARAIATRQPVLLLDEPTSGLDPRSQHQVLEAIARLRGSRTVVIVTHRPEPLALADVVVRLAPAP